MIKITVCPTCGSSKINKVRKDWCGNFHGQKYIVPSLEYHECPDCGEKIYDREAMRKIESLSPAFVRKHEKKVAVLYAQLD